MTTMTRQDWEQRYQSLRIEGRAFIDGSYRDAVGGATFDSISPVDGRQLASVASCCLLYTSPSPRDLSTSRMPSSA